MRDLDLGWLAGLLEGEGSFSRTRMEIVLVSSDQDVVLRAARLMGGFSKVKNHQANSLGSKQLWLCRVTGARARNVLTAILPHMGVRRSARIQSVLDNSHWGYPDSSRKAALRALPAAVKAAALKSRKLNEEQVRGIRRLDGIESQSRIGYRFGVSQTVISQILQKRTYKDVA